MDPSPPNPFATPSIPSVKAVAVSAVDAGTGFLAPLARIKEVIGADRILAVDAVQAFGAVPFDVEAADILAAGGQKWLRAGWGAAALLVRDRVADKLLPGLGGWSGVVDPIGPGELPHPTLPGALAHTVTNPDSIAVASYGAAVDLVIATGLKEINAAIRGNLDSLLEAVLEAGGETRNPSPQSGIATFRMPDIDPAELFARLENCGHPLHQARRLDPAFPPRHNLAGVGGHARGHPGFPGPCTQPLALPAAPGVSPTLFVSPISAYFTAIRKVS